MPKAYSYRRSSPPEQMQGESFRRRTSMAQAYALRKGLDLDDRLTFHDLGVSTYRGKNAETGRLSEFLGAVKAGLVARGSYLLVDLCGSLLAPARQGHQQVDGHRRECATRDELLMPVRTYGPTCLPPYLLGCVPGDLPRSRHDAHGFSAVAPSSRMPRARHAP